MEMTDQEKILVLKKQNRQLMRDSQKMLHRMRAARVATKTSCGDTGHRLYHNQETRRHRRVCFRCHGRYGSTGIAQARTKTSPHQSGVLTGK